MSTLATIFVRDLNKLESEINNFEHIENIWRTEGSVANSAGNLCLHLIGNLKHFIGATIGKTGYERNREEEFSLKLVDRKQLVDEIEQTKKVVSDSLNDMEEEQLRSIYPIRVFGEDMTYEYFLLHLLGHLNYHLGQINYLRRILEP
jgi:uncharacterized damage-inducible protein DinB